MNITISLTYFFFQISAIVLISTLGCLGSNASLPHSFGHAHKFQPIPDTVVGAHCKWEVRLNTVYNRVPPIITEIVCLTPNTVCGGNTNYKVKILFIFKAPKDVLSLSFLEVGDSAQ